MCFVFGLQAGGGGGRRAVLKIGWVSVQTTPPPSRGVGTFCGPWGLMGSRHSPATLLLCSYFIFTQCLL